MEFPNSTKHCAYEHLTSPTSKVQMVLDTDTYNEIDDQFAVVQALLSPDNSRSKRSTRHRSTPGGRDGEKLRGEPCGYWSVWMLRRRAWCSGGQRMIPL